MPRRKKDPTTRSRRNTAATAATLMRPEIQSVDDLADLSVDGLRAEIDRLNEDRPADQQIPKAGSKSALIDRVVAASSSIPAMPARSVSIDEDGIATGTEWHAQTVAWWNDVWTSPMSSEWDESDVHNVMVLALLYDDIWAADNARARKDALAEYRLQRADLGLSPYSRRRLEWTIETADEARDRGNKRRSGAGGRKPAGQSASTDEDPRLQLVQ